VRDLRHARVHQVLDSAWFATSRARIEEASDAGFQCASAHLD